MTSGYDKQKKLHFDVTNVGLRAQATAVGFVQLCVELKDAKVLDDAALERIKDAIADEVSVAAPRRISVQDHRNDIKARLDRLFMGEQKVGPVEDLPFGEDPDA
jgi:hypothetical protein